MKRKIIKATIYIISVVLILMIGLSVALWLKSPGKAEPITNDRGEIIPTSISVIDSVQLGGINQYIIIRGADTTKPVMLFVHGGPGGPEVGMMKATNRAIENDFVMVYWEQRGSGKSYNPNVPPETMNLNQFIKDAGELSQYLVKRFGRDKIYIMGHSWGSLLGILTAYHYPELFHAYFGIGQIGNQYQGELVSFEWVKEQAQAQHDDEGIKELQALTFPDSLATNAKWDEFLAVERNYVMKYGGGAMRELRGIMPLVKMIFLTHEYTVKEKIGYLKGSDFSVKYLWPEVINTNLFTAIDSMKVPVYIMQGLYDYQTPYPMAEEFYHQLKASEKKFFVFDKSAHSPNMEEIEKFNSLVRDLAKDK